MKKFLIYFVYINSLLCASILFLGCESNKGPSSVETNEANPTYRYVIASGTFDRIRLGLESKEIIPRQLKLKVGDVIQIKNEDSQGGVIGPFYVGPGETLTQKFTTKGTYIGECNIHPSGRIEIIVS